MIKKMESKWIPHGLKEIIEPEIYVNIMNFVNLFELLKTQQVNILQQVNIQNFLNVLKQDVSNITPENLEQLKNKNYTEFENLQSFKMLQPIFSDNIKKLQSQLFKILINLKTLPDSIWTKYNEKYPIYFLDWPTWLQVIFLFIFIYIFLSSLSILDFYLHTHNLTRFITIVYALIVIFLFVLHFIKRQYSTFLFFTSVILVLLVLGLFLFLVIHEKIYYNWRELVVPFLWQYYKLNKSINCSLQEK